MPTERRTWILLRGLARSSAHWGPFIDQFRQRFPQDEVLALDLPGVGEFRDVRSPRTMNGIFTFVRAKAIERARAQSPFHLVTISLGGMVAMEWMRSRPEDLGACVLMNSSCRPLSPAHMRLRWQIWPEFIRLVSMQSVRERERRLIELLINNPEARERALPLWIKLANEHSISYLNFMSQLASAARFDGLTEAPRLPVLLLNGLGDRLVDPSCSSAMHRKWNWPLERHPWAGHDLTWDDPQWVLEKIEAWNNHKDTSRN